MMKKFVLTIISCLWAFGAMAQSDKTLNLYYFDHERSVPISKLCAQIEEIFTTSASDMNSDTFLYLANAGTPLILYCREDNRSEMLNMVNEIRSRRSHTVFPEDDVQKLTEFFNEHDYIDNEGRHLYDMVNVSFYIGENFWVNGYPETLIARLAFIMDWGTLEPEFFHLDIFRAEEDNFDYDNDIQNMFGAKQLIPPVPYILTY